MAAMTTKTPKNHQIFRRPFRNGRGDSGSWAGGMGAVKGAGLLLMGDCMGFSYHQPS